MKLRQRTLLMIGVALVSLVGVLYATSSTILLGNIARLETEDTRRNVRRTLDAFDEEINKLNFTVRDWAEWDETYQFIRDRNSEYVTSNLNKPTLDRLRINLILFSQPSGEVVFGRSLDTQNQRSGPVPERLLAFFKSHRLLDKSLQGQSAGILLLPEGPMLISVRPILTGEGRGPARGTLMMGRYLDTDAVERLAHLTHLSLTTQPVNSPQLPNDFAKVLRQLPPDAGQADTILVQPLNRDRVAGYALLNDIYDQPAVLVRADLPREIYRQGKISQRYLMLLLLGIGISFGAGTLWLLERLVLLRLAQLSRDVGKISTSGDLSLRVATSGQDELAHLGDTINHMLTALEQAQQELKQSQQAYRSVVDNVQEVIFQVDAEGLWKFLNPAWTEITGFAVESTLGKSFLNSIHADDRPYHRSQFQRLLAQEIHNYHAELRLVTAERKDRWFTIDAHPTLDESGQVLGLSGVLNDLTGQKQAAAAVNLLQTITQAVSAAEDFAAALEIALSKVCEATDWDYGEAWVLAENQTTLELSPGWYSNKAILEDFRQLSEAFTFQVGMGLPGRVWRSQQPEWIPDVSQQAHSAFLRVHISLEVGLKAGFGVPIISNETVVAVLVFFMFEARQEDQALVELVSAVAMQLGAVMQRKQAEEALRLAEEKYRSIFENSLEGIFQTTPEGRYLSANPALAEIYGYTSPSELITELGSQQAYVDPQRRAEFIAALETQGAIARFESEVFRRDGCKIWISETARAVRDPKGKLLYYEGTVADITDRKRVEEALRLQQEKAEQLLLNILPEAIAEKLKQQPGAIADSFSEVTVLFADIVNFTQLAARLSPTELVNLLNQIFSAFDRLAEQHGLEKIKTIGDAYMAVGGVPIPTKNHAAAIAEMALDMQAAVVQLNLENQETFPIRIGINTGPVIAGVIGIKKFIYDLWGDTVNIASRMESEGMPGCIQVTEATYQRLQDQYLFIERGEIPIKGRGHMNTYLLIGRKSSPTESSLEVVCTQ